VNEKIFDIFSVSDSAYIFAGESAAASAAAAEA
jgi:hypothetical protein